MQLLFCLVGGDHCRSYSIESLVSNLAAGLQPDLMSIKMKIFSKLIFSTLTSQYEVLQA